MRGKQEAGDITPTSLNMSTLLNFNNFGVFDDHVKMRRGVKSESQGNHVIQRSHDKTEIQCQGMEETENSRQGECDLVCDKIQEMKSEVFSNGMTQRNNNDEQTKDIAMETDNRIDELVKEHNDDIAQLKHDKCEKQWNPKEEEVERGKMNVNVPYRKDKSMEGVQSPPGEEAHIENNGDIPRNKNKISRAQISHGGGAKVEKRSNADISRSGVKISAIYNIVSQHRCSLCPLFTVNYITIGGRLCISVLYYTDLTPKTTAQVFAEKLLENLITCKD